MKYEIEEKNPDWLNKVPRYNTATRSKFHGIIFEYYIRSAITDRYTIMYSITVHDKILPTYVDVVSIGVGIAIPKNATTSALETLVVTLNFIYFWLKHFHHNYQVR